MNKHMRRRLTPAQRVSLLIFAGVFPDSMKTADYRMHIFKMSYEAYWSDGRISLFREGKLTPAGEKRVAEVKHSWLMNDITVGDAAEAYKRSRKRGAKNFSYYVGLCKVGISPALALTNPPMTCQTQGTTHRWEFDMSVAKPDGWIDLGYNEKVHVDTLREAIRTMSDHRSPCMENGFVLSGYTCGINVKQGSVVERVVLLKHPCPVFEPFGDPVMANVAGGVSIGFATREVRDSTWPLDGMKISAAIRELAERMSMKIV